MLVKSLSVAVFATIACVTSAFGQSRPPAEVPPAGYAGQQYVDSRGCIYVRAGHGGQVNWVARIDRSRRPICGLKPSLAEMAEARAALSAPETTAPQRAASAPRTASVPPSPQLRQTPSQASSRAAAPVAAPAAPATAVVAARAGQRDLPPATLGGHPTLVNRAAGCPAETPHAGWYVLQDGRRTLLCSDRPHQLAGLVPSDQPQPRGSGRYGVAPSPGAGEPAGDLMSPPPGYKAAWRDGRLNPYRGPRSASGEVQMDRSWTRQVPQQLRSPEQALPETLRQAAQPPARVSSRSRTEAVPVQAVRSGRYVQIGSFAQAANVGRAVSRLQGMGLPVQVSRARLRGQELQVVSAGPFRTASEATQVLGRLRAAGYGDAILRR